MQHQSEAEETKGSGDLVDAAVKGIRWMSGARVLAEIIGLGTMVVLARLIPPAEFGIFVITLLVQELALSILGESVGSALVQRPEARREHFQVGQTICLAVGGLLAIATLLAAPVLIGPFFGGDAVALVQLSTPIFLLVALGTVPQAMLQRRLDFQLLGLIQIVSLLVRCATAIALALFAGMDAEALVIAGLAAGLVGTSIAIASVRLPPPAYNRSAARDLAGYGVPAGIAAISWIGFRNADYLIVGARLGLAATGIYWRAFQLAVEYQKRISTLLYQIGFPVLSRSESLEGMLAMRFRIMRVLTVSVFPLLAGLAVLAPDLVPWLFGSAWSEAVVPTQILVVAGAASLVIDGVGTTMMAAGRPRALLGYGWSHFIVYAAAVALVAPMGVVAVAVAVVAVHAVFLFIAYGVLLRGMVERPLRQMWGDVGPATVASLALAAVAVPLRLALGATGAPLAVVLLVVPAAGAGVYVAVLSSLFPASWRDFTTLARRVMPSRPSRRTRTDAVLAGVSR